MYIYVHVDQTTLTSEIDELQTNLKPKVAELNKVEGEEYSMSNTVEPLPYSAAANRFIIIQMFVFYCRKRRVERL